MPDKKSDMQLLMITIGSVLVVWILASITMYKFIGDWTTRGQFGDMFGALNCLFSGLAFAGLISAIMLQKKELALQREELQLTRDQLSRSADAQEKSESALNRQFSAMQKTAYLSGLSSMVEHYNVLISQTDIAETRRGLRDLQRNHIEELKTLLSLMKDEIKTQE